MFSFKAPHDSVVAVYYDQHFLHRIYKHKLNRATQPTSIALRILMSALYIQFIILKLWSDIVALQLDFLMYYIQFLHLPNVLYVYNVYVEKYNRSKQILYRVRIALESTPKNNSSCRFCVAHLYNKSRLNTVCVSLYDLQKLGLLHACRTVLT